MDKKVLIGPPDLEARVELLKLYMGDRPQEKIAWVRLAERCTNYTAAELEHIVNEAARIALTDRRTISERDIMLALTENPPQLESESAPKQRRAGF
jgi:SpoVK/Ycf46/Vps4 family AAA+-type ATPase